MLYYIQCLVNFNKSLSKITDVAKRRTVIDSCEFESYGNARSYFILHKLKLEKRGQTPLRVQNFSPGLRVISLTSKPNL